MPAIWKMIGRELAANDGEIGDDGGGDDEDDEADALAHAIDEDDEADALAHADGEECAADGARPPQRQKDAPPLTI